MAPFFLLLSLSKSFIDMLIQFQLQKPSCSYNKSHRKMPPDGWNAAPPFLPLSFSSRDRPMDQSVSWIQLRHLSLSLFRHVIAQCYWTFVVDILDCITTHNKMFKSNSGKKDPSNLPSLVTYLISDSTTPSYQWLYAHHPKHVIYTDTRLCRHWRC